MVTNAAQHVEELAHRDADGIEVSLLWSPADDSLTVSCVDARTEERFTIAAEPSIALDVFHHPYAYAARQHIGDRMPVTSRGEALVV